MDMWEDIFSFLNVKRHKCEKIQTFSGEVRKLYRSCSFFLERSCSYTPLQ